MTASVGPPFRADPGGSLFRPGEIKEGRAQGGGGGTPPRVLRGIEDRYIRDAVARQEALGLEAVTDGEFRRGWWNHDFLGRVDGVGGGGGPKPGGVVCGGG